MTAPRCCRNRETDLRAKKAEMHRAARQAVRLADRFPRYIEAANQAKAEYIRSRAELEDHLTECAEATA